MIYTPGRICCPSCKMAASLDKLGCSCQQCDYDFNPFFTFGGCPNCHWTVGRLRCKVCGNRHDLADWIDIPSGERSMIRFFRELMQMREIIQIRNSESAETATQDPRVIRVSSVVVVSARIIIRGRRVEKEVKVEDLSNVLARLFTEGYTSEERMTLYNRECHLDRRIFEHAIKRLTKDIRLACKLRKQLKGSTIRMNVYGVERMAGQLKTLRGLYDLIKGKKADLFFSIYRGRTLQPNPPESVNPAKNYESTDSALHAHQIMLVNDLPTWSDAIVAGSEKLLEFFTQVIQSGRKEGNLVVRCTQPRLAPEFSESFFARDFLQCSTYLLGLFEEWEQYEQCAQIISLQKILKEQPYSTEL